jgi:hypothetical protein
MHPNLDELLALRDGDGSTELRRHVDGCEQCRAEIEDFHSIREALGSLPQCPPPEGSWEAIRLRLPSGRRRPVDLRIGVAAAVVLGLVTAVFIARLGPSDGAVESITAADTREVLEQLSKASRELELVLQDSSLRSPVLSPRQAAMIVELEDRIALVDLAIAQSRREEPDRLAVALWSDRVELLDALVTARSGVARFDGIVRVSNGNERSQQ